MKYTAHPTAVIDEGCVIGDDTKIWHFAHIMPNCKIGERCNIGQNVVVSPEVILGNNVKVQNNVSIYTGVTCDDDVFLGPSMVFTTLRTCPDPWQVGQVLKVTPSALTRRLTFIFFSTPLAISSSVSLSFIRRLEPLR